MHRIGNASISPHYKRKTYRGEPDEEADQAVKAFKAVIR
jgi:hypothetical protein